jgi:AcrR family transcriptional regulator
VTDWSVRMAQIILLRADMNKKKEISNRKKILLAAEEVFSENGFHKTLVEDISKKAGLGKGTIYRYFENKRELFKSLIVESFDELKGVVSAEANKHEDTIEKLRAGIKTYLEFFKQHKKLFLILILEPGEVGCGDESECFEKYTDNIKSLNAFFTKGIKGGVFKDIAPETLSYGILGLVNYIIFKWMMSREEYDIMDELEAIYEIIFNGALLK